VDDVLLDGFARGGEGPGDLRLGLGEGNRIDSGGMTKIGRRAEG